MANVDYSPDGRAERGAGKHDHSYFSNLIQVPFRRHLLSPH
jgi:hypothetical protein